MEYNVFLQVKLILKAIIYFSPQLPAAVLQALWWVLIKSTPVHSTKNQLNQHQCQCMSIPEMSL